MATRNWWDSQAILCVARIAVGLMIGTSGAACADPPCPDGAPRFEGRCPYSCTQFDTCGGQHDATETGSDAPNGDGGTDAEAAVDGAGDGAEGGDGGGGVQPPRPVAPMSTAYVTSQQPVLRWALASGSDGAQVEVCRDRAFTMACQRFDASGETTTVPTALARGVWFWRLRGKSGAMVGARTSPIWEFTAPARSAAVNTSWGSAVDVNGDGFADAIASAAGMTGASGRVHVFLGRAAGLGEMPDITLDMASLGAAFVPALATAGDVNGDGFGDVVIAGSQGDGSAGRALVFLGGPGGIGTRADFTLLDPEGATGSYGSQASSAGDVDRDGYGDLVVSAPNARSGAGRVYVYRGSASGLPSMPTLELANPEGSGNLDLALSPFADVNGDGFSDVVTAAAGCARGGCVHVFHGGPSGLGLTPSSTIVSPDMAFGYFGLVAGAVHDLNGDGLADVAVAAWGGRGTAGDHTGRVYLLPGSRSGLQAVPLAILDGIDGTNGYFGYNVVGLGDLDGDGFGELLIDSIAPTTGVGSGRVDLFHGAASGVSPTRTRLNVSMDLGFGFAMSGAGDVDGDGIADALIGAYASLSGAGRLYFYRGVAAGLSEPPARIVDGTDGPNSFFAAEIAR